MTNGSGICAACSRAIDVVAKVCPYCGANPSTGERIDTQAILQEVFRPKELTTSDNIIEYARQRQGIVIAVSLLVGFLVLTGIHQFVTRRNATDVVNSTAVPLTEITDLSNQVDESKPQPMPPLEFQYEGRPQSLRTFVVERGATVPPEIALAQQAAMPNAAVAGVARPAPQAGALRPGAPAIQPGAPLPLPGASQIPMQRIPARPATPAPAPVTPSRPNGR